MRNAIAERNNSSGCTYYKSLTALTFCISRQRPWCGNASTSSFISIFFTRIYEWGLSCLKGKGALKAIALVSSEPRGPSSSTTMMKIKVDENKMTEVSSVETKGSSLEQKPLRERVSSSAVAAAPPPVLFKKKVIIVKEKAKEVTIIEKEREFVWAHKYRPRALKDFICNKNKAEQLLALVKNGECSHFIFEGPPGVGKRTMVWAMLIEIFGPDRLQTREECKEFELKGEAVASIHVNVKVSSQHLEMNLSELHGYEKHVIVSLIKETQSGISCQSQAMPWDNTKCRAIILYGADKLSTDAQIYLLWLLERYKGCNKIFFCCSDISRLETIRSLCMVIQLLPPSNEEIVQVLELIAEQEGIELPHHLAERIAGNSKHNLQQAVRSFEATWHLNYPFKEDQVLMTGWEEDIANIAKNIIEEQNPKQLYIIRGKFQNLIEYNVSPDFIFSTLVGELKKHLNEQYHPQIDALYQDYNRDNEGVINSKKSLVPRRNRHKESGKRINDPRRHNVHYFMRIEEFTAKFMSFYKKAVVKNVKEPEEQTC